jgi:hypothetical protein
MDTGKTPMWLPFISKTFAWITATKLRNASTVFFAGTPEEKRELVQETCSNRTLREKTLLF